MVSFCIESLYEKLCRKWTPEKKRTAAVCFISTAAFSLAAHGFLFTNEFFSHDSATGFYYDPSVVNTFYAGIGRFLIPFYDLIKGSAAAPWLIGLLFILWTGLSSLLAVRMLNIKSSAGTALVSGLMCTNLSLTLTGATYIYCLDDYAFALFTALLGAYLIERGKWLPMLFGTGLLAISLAVYQPYFTIAACFLLFKVMKTLADGKPVLKAVKNGITYVLLLGAGFICYYVLWGLVCRFTGVARERINESLLSGANGSVFTLIKNANLAFADFLLGTDRELGWFLVIVHICLLAFIAARLIIFIYKGKIPVINKTGLVILFCLLPTAFNAVYVTMPGNAHGLTTYGRELIYILAVYAAEPFFRDKNAFLKRVIPTVLLCLTLWQHTVTANQIYLKKELEKNATVALASRLIDRIENTEGYVPGFTPVTFVGTLEANTYLSRGWPVFESFDYISKLTGLKANYLATYNLDNYLNYYLNYPIFPYPGLDLSDNKEVKAMPCFPAQGSVKTVENAVVVKLSE